MEIRRFETKDRDQLVDLWKRVFPNDPPHNHPDTVIDAKTKVDSLIFVAVDAGVLLGAVMAGYDGHRGWLYALAVDHTFRRQGIGTQLVRHAVKALQSLGCVKVNLQVRAENRSVIAFYESLGFSVEPRVSMGQLLNY